MLSHKTLEERIGCLYGYMDDIERDGRQPKLKIEATLALIREVVEEITPESDTRAFPGIEPGQDPVRETCWKQGRNEAIAEIQSKAQELLG